jgi:hypothetical protein
MCPPACLPWNKLHYTNVLTSSIALCQRGTQVITEETEETTENLASQRLNFYKAPTKAIALNQILQPCDTVHSNTKSCTHTVWLYYWVTQFFLSTCSHNGTGPGKNDATCPRRYCSGTESGNLRTGASWSQQWHRVSESDWLLSMIKSGWDKVVIWVSRSRNKRRETTANVQKLN